MPVLMGSNHLQVNLRPLRATDTQLLFTYAKTLESEDTFILLNRDQPVTFSEEQDYVAKSMLRVQANWEIYYLAFAGEHLIGTSQITVCGRRKMHVGTFGISLLPKVRGLTLGRQFAQFMLSEAVNTLNLNTIILEVFATNSIALNLYQSLGFTEYGRLPQGLSHQQAYVDSVLMFKSFPHKSI